MQLDLLKHIASSVGGSSASKIVEILYGKKNVSEAIITKKLKLTVNQTRNVLYRLADEGLVSFVRKKNSKKGGWYDYFWTLNSGKGLIKFKEKLEKNIENLQQQKNYRKSARFFFCSSCEKEYTEEQALIHNYTCPECGEVFILKDTSSEVAQLDRDIHKLKSVLDSVNKEVEVINIQKEKALKRKLLSIKRKQEKTKKEKKLRLIKAKKNLGKAVPKAKVAKGKSSKSKRKL